MTKRSSIVSVAMYGIGGVVCILAGATSINTASAENNDLAFGILFIIVGIGGICHAADLMRTRS